MRSQSRVKKKTKPDNFDPTELSGTPEEIAAFHEWRRQRITGERARIAAYEQARADLAQVEALKVQGGTPEQMADYERQWQEAMVRVSAAHIGDIPDELTPEDEEILDRVWGHKRG
jgi:hypothetical protein